MTFAIHGFAHVGLRVRDIQQSKNFYVDFLGFQVLQETSGLILVRGYGIVLGIQGDNPETKGDDYFNPFRVGLDHLALAVADKDELESILQQLNTAHIRNNGIQTNLMTHQPYISFYDPDGIAWEFYPVSSAS
jgi:glyoxylase I family protein